MKSLLIFASLFSITLGFPVGSPLHKRERRRRQLGYGYGFGYGQVHPFYVPFLQPGLNNDFTPEIYIRGQTRRSTRRPVTPKPARRTTSMVQPVPFNGDPCPPPREDNNDQLPVFIYVDPKEWSSMGGDQLISSGQFSDPQPAFAFVPGLFFRASESSQVTQSPIKNTPKPPDPIRVSESQRKDC